jgi:hypothetical protein
MFAIGVFTDKPWMTVYKKGGGREQYLLYDWKCVWKSNNIYQNKTKTKVHLLTGYIAAHINCFLCTCTSNGQKDCGTRLCIVSDGELTTCLVNCTLFCTVICRLYKLRFPARSQKKICPEICIFPAFSSSGITVYEVCYLFYVPLHYIYCR